MTLKNIITLCLFMLWPCTSQPTLINQLTDSSTALKEAYNNLAMFGFEVEEQKDKDQDGQEQEVDLNTSNGTCAYSNTTNVPMVLSFVVGTITAHKHIPSQGLRYQPYPTTPDLQVTAHANLSPIARNYTNKSSYDIVINSNNKLNLVASAQDGKTISNKTLWRMLINATSSDGDDINIQLAPGQSQPLPDNIMFVMIIPLIEEKTATPTPAAQQCVISNNKGAIDLKFNNNNILNQYYVS